MNIADIDEQITQATVWLRRAVDMGPYEPADHETQSFTINVLKGSDNMAQRLEDLAAILHPGWFFDGWHVAYVDLQNGPF